MKLNRWVIDFLKHEKASGIILILCTLISLILANSSIGKFWVSIFNFSFFNHSVLFLVNEGLMTFFFLLIGLELKRELLDGKLSNFKFAILPAIAAIGGMIVPATIHYLLNRNSATQSGSGIPMATDIAFSLGILGLLGNRIPNSLKIFLVALAIIDDLGAIVTIAFFYSQQIAWLFLLTACFIFALLLLLNKLNRSEAWLYVLSGIILWYCLLQSGVHPTIGGVLLAFAIPFKTIKNSSLAENYYHQLNKPVAFVIVPLFALANTAIFIPDGAVQQLFSSNSLGIFLGLVIGKPLGITLFTLLAITIGIGKLPFDIKMKHIFGAGLLGGIGFTMSMFISMLAFDTTEIQEISKLTIIVSSAVAAALGWLWLKLIKN